MILKTANSFCLHKLFGKGRFFFLHAHLTLHEFCFLGRKDILWFHLQMAQKDICPHRLYEPGFWLFWEYFLRRLMPVLPCLFFSFSLYCAWCSADLSLEQVMCQLLEKGDLLVADITKTPWKIKRILFFFFYLTPFSLSSCKLVQQAEICCVYYIRILYKKLLTKNILHLLRLDEM